MTNKFFIFHFTMYPDFTRYSKENFTLYLYNAPAQDIEETFQFLSHMDLKGYMDRTVVRGITSCPYYSAMRTAYDWFSLEYHESAFYFNQLWEEGTVGAGFLLWSGNCGCRRGSDCSIRGFKHCTKHHCTTGAP